MHTIYSSELYTAYPYKYEHFWSAIIMTSCEGYRSFNHWHVGVQVKNETVKLLITEYWSSESAGDREIPLKRASDAESIFMTWRHCSLVATTLAHIRP